MFTPSGFTTTDTAALWDTLAVPHDAHTVAHVYTLDRDFVGELDVLEWQVDGRANEPVERIATATLRDPDGIFAGPSMHLMVSLVQVVRVPGLRTVQVTRMVEQVGPTRLPVRLPVTLGQMVTPSQVTEEVPAFGIAECPLFTGPVARPASRQGDAVALEMQDRSSLWMRGRPPKTYPAGKRTVATIKQILLDCGEPLAYVRTIADTIDADDRLDDPVTIGWEEELRPLVQIRELAESVDLHFYYDTAGWPRLREFPADGDAIDLTRYVTGTEPVEVAPEVATRVKVVGKKPGEHVAVRTLDDVAPNHPLGPSALSVGGVPQYLNTLEERKPKFNSEKKARKRAVRLMRRELAKLTETHTYTLAPVPLLDLHDTVQIRDETLTVRRFSLSDEAMTLGYSIPIGG